MYRYLILTPEDKVYFKSSSGFSKEKATIMGKSYLNLLILIGAPSFNNFKFVIEKDTNNLIKEDV